MKKKIKTTLVIGLIGMMVISSVSAVGFGLFPMQFTIEDAQRGETYDQSLTIMNVDNESCAYGFEGVGEIGDWYSFYALDGETAINMTEVPAKSNKQIIARVMVPNETANGTYTGKIYVKSIPKNVTGTTGGAAAVAVLITTSRGTIIVTGKQNLSGTVTNITAMDTEVNNTLRVKVEFQNTGDVIATPAINVSIAINESLVDCIYYDKTAVMPGANETIAVEWSTTGQIPGNYSLNVSVCLNTDVLATKDLTVRIQPPGTLTPEVPKGELSTEM